MEVDSKSLFDFLQRIVRCLRTGSYAESASLLNLALQQLQLVLTDNGMAQTDRAKILYSLETMHLLQQQEDWVAVADVIEYELAKLLHTALH
ncbi:MAG: hypothetical protein GF398_07100 [Chitinivibrionales bacterium]|nr:hypothetical protein [Chitinivibrionales bacterium]